MPVVLQYILSEPLYRDTSHIARFLPIDTPSYNPAITTIQVLS